MRRIYFAVQTPDGLFSRHVWAEDSDLPIKGQILVFGGDKEDEASFVVGDVVRYWDHHQIYVHLNPLPPSVANPDHLRRIMFKPDDGSDN